MTQTSDLAQYLQQSQNQTLLPLQLWRNGQQYIVYVDLQAGKTAVEAT